MSLLTPSDYLHYVGLALDTALASLPAWRDFGLRLTLVTLLIYTVELHESFSSHGNFLSHTICLVLYRVHAKEQGDPVGSLCQNNIIVVDIDR